MDPTIIVALLSLAGTLVGSFGGIMITNKLAMYRIEQLEKKVDSHNAVVERTALNERDLKTVFRHIDDMRTEIKELRS